VTEAVVASGAELNGYSGWSASNYLRIANPTDLDFGTGDFSISFWTKPDSTNGRNAWVRYQDGNNYLAFRKDGLNWRFDFRKGGASKLVEPVNSVNIGVWQFIVITRVGDALKMFIDGVLAATTTGVSALSATFNSSSALTIGGDAALSSVYDGAFSLMRWSATAPSATQIRQMYDAEKGMFVANAECLLQSGTTDAVIDVDVDPLSGKVIVTQTDAITIFDGLVVDSKPTVNSGASEKGKLWGDLRAEQNSANAYVTAPATDQRQVNEMVRGLASDLPAGVDLSKAKAWIRFDGVGTVGIDSSYNVKSLGDAGTGQWDMNLAIPFKSVNGMIILATASNYEGGGSNYYIDIGKVTTSSIRVRCVKHDGTLEDADPMWCVVFGELENE
jgi:hypothetical protein